jgi:hypothetical protein
LIRNIEISTSVDSVSADIFNILEEVAYNSPALSRSCDTASSIEEEVQIGDLGMLEDIIVLVHSDLETNVLATHIGPLEICCSTDLISVQVLTSIA